MIADIHGLVVRRDWESGARSSESRGRAGSLNHRYITTSDYVRTLSIAQDMYIHHSTGQIR